MIATTANFDAARSALQQQPVVVLSLPALGLTYTNRPGQPGLVPTATFLQMPAGLSQTVDDLQGSATIGQLTATVVDRDRALLPTLGSKQWYGTAATLQLGFAGLTYPTDYIVAFAGQVESIVPTDDHTGWTISIRDKNRKLTNQVYGTGDDGATPTSASNPRTLDGNPLDLVTSLLETELGIAAGDVDTAAITALRNGRFSCTRMLFSLTKAVNAKTFLEQELLRPNGLFHFVRNTGAISVGDVLAPPAPVSVAYAFTARDTIGIPKFRQAPIYNWVQFDLDYDGNKYLHTEEFLNTASVAKYDLQAVLQIQSQGLRTNLQGASRAGITARRIFQRYADAPANQITLDSPSLKPCIVEVGDYVTVTHPLMEDLDTGTLGWTNRVCQVLSVQPNWAAGTISFNLVDVTRQIGSAFQYAPDTVPSWPTATAPQRQEYMFLANASSEQSDGTAAGGVY
jgi:hypothetical protein